MLRNNIKQCPRCDGAGSIRIVSPESLRQTREAAGISLRTVAKRLKLSAPYVSDIELGRRNCPEAVEKFYRKLEKRKN